MDWQKALVVVIVFSVIPIWGAGQADVLHDVQMIFTHEVGGILIDSGYRETVVRQAEDLVRLSQEIRFITVLSSRRS